MDESKKKLKECRKEGVSIERLKGINHRGRFSYLGVQLQKDL
jgi:hypothetical protein